MPIVRTRKAMDQVLAGQTVEVLATDKGSLTDIKAWAESTGHQYIGTIEENGVLKHYIRKAEDGETKEPAAFDRVIDNEAFLKKLDGEAQIIDVREEAEYAFEHIPGAINIPLGELDERAGELNKSKSTYVVCRTGNRSDMACRKLADKGFANITNVVPGMSGWSGPTEGQNK